MTSGFLWEDHTLVSDGSTAGANDFALVKMDNLGRLGSTADPSYATWIKKFGGIGAEQEHVRMVELFDGGSFSGYLLAGSSDSFSDDVSIVTGKPCLNYNIMKLDSEANTIERFFQ